MNRKQLIKICKTKLEVLKNQYIESLSGPLDTESQKEIVDLTNTHIGMQDTAYLRERIRKVLPEVEFALRRITQGTYGICQMTGDLIEEKRLIAIPWTRVSLQEIEGGNR